MHVRITQEDFPRKWYNILPDLPETLPAYKEAKSGKEIKCLPTMYTKAASQLEFSNERWINIPNQVIESLLLCDRPHPLIRAQRLEEFLKTPAEIYFKCESLPPAGTFKVNTALPQAYWAMKEGYERTVSISSAGKRTPFAHVFAARTFGLTPTLFMTRTACEQNIDHVFFLKKMYEADLLESPSDRTKIGRKILKENPNHPGSYDIVQKEVTEEARQNKDAVVVESGFLNHILITQSIIGLEIEKQLEIIDKVPNILVGAVGSGSHFYGLIAPFMRDYLKKKFCNIKFLAVETETLPKLTNGKYDYFSRAGPFEGLLAKSYEIACKIPPSNIMGMGIQVKNAAPIISFLHHLGFIDTIVYPKDEKAIYEAARIFLQTEGHLLAPEAAYSIRAVIDEAIKAKRKKENKIIVVSLSATSYLDFGEKRRYVTREILE